MGLSQVIKDKLGQCYTASEVAKALSKRPGWVYRHATTLGGIKIGGEWQFFEKNIVSALRSTSKGGFYAGKTEKPQDGKIRVLRQDYSAERATKGEEIPIPPQGFGMGSADQAEIARTLEADPCGLLAQSHD